MSAFYTAIVEDGGNINQVFALDKRFRLTQDSQARARITAAIRPLFAKKKVR